MDDINAMADPATLKALRVLQQIKRERRRVSQQKYMKKKSRAAADLEKYMPLLRDEVQEFYAEDLERLRVVVAPDVDAGAFTGFESLVANWRTFTMLFADVQIRLEGLRQIANDSLIASTTFSFTITMQSLQKVFPHLVNDARDQKQRIVVQLLGQRIALTGSVRFGWDSASKRVTKLYAQADMVSPLLQLVSSPEAVSIIFRGALITPDCNLVVAKAMT
ncbi:hypothetical protein PR002_g25522 [Phytophthora rubi]|uniref:Uncharacterized protein n=1 Tax=Phytophthora rubi TaxID=129364 RepID=A0A6A3I125_9STRA|nr:hypothetical protein PR002_g25522 [Phytophthora rubi]